MSLSAIRKVYDRYASFYDVIFGSLFQDGRCICTKIVNKIAPRNAKVLELGVGTGLSLPLYRADLDITGIDISEKMLDKAHERIKKNEVTAKTQLHVMDIADLKFPDNHFDIVVAMYVASVVPDIDQCLREISRVCKPKGDIIFLNHFASEKPIMHFLEKNLAWAYRFIGFKSDFSIDTIFKQNQFELLQSVNTNIFGYWKLLHCRSKKVQ